MHPLVQVWPSIESKLLRYLESTVWRSHAEDLSQDSFLALWEQWDDRGRSLAQRSEKELTAYAIGIARNKGKALYRSDSARLKREASVAAMEPSQVELYDEHDGVPVEVRPLLEHLPPREADVLRLTAELGMSRREVAEVLGISTSTVKTYITRARVAFRREPDAAA